jgi:hypothetical protein
MAPWFRALILCSLAFFGLTAHLHNVMIGREGGVPVIITMALRL